MARQSCGICRYYENTGTEDSGLRSYQADDSGRYFYRGEENWIYIIGSCLHPGKSPTMTGLANWCPGCPDFRRRLSKGAKG